jgi:superfamily II DNA/RNA helicase
MLFKTGLIKALLSSPQALQETVQTRMKKLESQLNDISREKVDEAGIRADLSTLQDIQTLAGKIGTTHFSKSKHLFETLLPALGVRGSNSDPRLVIFSERLATIELLRGLLCERLKLDICNEKPGSGSLAVLTGTESDVRIQEVLESFGSRDGKVRVLLASDMASEGINLHHFCHHLIHFDVPWSFIRLEQRNGRIDRFGQTKSPTIRYLLTGAENPEVRGDVQVVEKLIAKAENARKNLGDEGAVLHLYDPEKEEQGIACAISAGAAKSDQALESGLSEIRAEALQAAAAEAGEEDTEPWFLQGFFGEPVVTKNSANREQSIAGERGSAQSRVKSEMPTVDVRQTLYNDDLQYLSRALDELKPVFKAEGEPLEFEFHPNRPELTLRAPAELRNRLEQLPKEAKSSDDRIFLTTDRAAVECAIEKSRDEKGAWPDLQLLWPLHPVLEWINDRVLVGFGRDQAPVIVLPQIAERFDGTDAVALMQGTLSNKRGQAVVCEWFGLPTKIGRQPGAPVKVFTAVELETVIDKVGLRGSTPNQAKASMLLNALSKARSAWLEASIEHMKLRRTERKNRIKPELNATQQRLKTWERQVLERLEKRKNELMENRPGPLRDRWQMRLKEEEERVSRLRRDRSKWLEETLATDERPYLKLVAVLAAR